MSDMSHMHLKTRNRRDQRGAALMLSLIVITSLLGLGALTVLSVKSDLAAAGQTRFSAAATYAAESGAEVGMDFLRTSCSTSQLFTPWISAGNAHPLMPPGIIGNGVLPGVGANPFDAATGTWYEVTIYNNLADPGLAAGIDNDGTVVLHSVGHGPDGTTAVIELETQNTTCLANFCEHDFTQRNVTSRNDASTACSARVASGSLRTFTP
jgi:hypothetical protein